MRSTPFLGIKPSQWVRSIAPKRDATVGLVVTKSKAVWSVLATEEQLQLFYINHLFFHEVGHHIDWYYRHFSAANEKAIEDTAYQYTNEKSQEALDVLERLQEFRSWDA